MLFLYKVLDEGGAAREGTIDATSEDAAIASLQRRGFTIVSIEEQEERGKGLSLTLFERVTTREIVILSRQISTLFEAQISALRIFRLLSAESTSPLLARKLAAVADDIQGGNAISKALSRHPDVFTPFYVNMVRAGEESGKLDETFLYLADYLDRSYEVTSKARNALIYPAFVIFTFVTVMILMLTLVIPKLSEIIEESGQEVPLYTKIVVSLSAFFVDYGVFLLIFLAVGAVFLWRFARTPRGAVMVDAFKISIPYVGEIYRKLYLSRITDNLATMLQSGIPMVRGLEITSSVVDNEVYSRILLEAAEAVKGGTAVSDALGRHGDIPSIVSQMAKVGEESGELGSILKTLAKFYQREVTNAVETLVNLIEPVMIVLLALGVGVLLASVLLPIYNIAGSI